MPHRHASSLLETLPADSPLVRQRTNDQMLDHAFNALPDGAFLFGSDRRLIKGNANAAQLQDGDFSPGRPCCEMFWRVEGADGCIVDRAIESGERVEVEIQSGAEQNLSISIIVEPLVDDDGGPGALVIARDISDLRRAVFIVILTRTTAGCIRISGQHPRSTTSRRHFEIQSRR